MPYISQKYIMMFRNVYTQYKVSDSMSENSPCRPTYSEMFYWTVTTNIFSNLVFNHILGQSLNGNGITESPIWLYIILIDQSFNINVYFPSKYIFIRWQILYFP